MKKVLFLCTGNYYRSRFAEELFNHLAAERGLDWRADSSALAIEIGRYNVGPISKDTLAALVNLGVASEDPRYPKACTDAELGEADLVVALKELEHRPMLASRHPGWADRVEYWHVHDLDQSSADVALTEIRQHVIRLIERLSNPEPEPSRG